MAIAMVLELTPSESASELAAHWPRIHGWLGELFPGFDSDHAEPVICALGSDLQRGKAIPLGEAVARLALALQRRTGSDVQFWECRDDPVDGLQTLSFATLDPATGLLAAKLAASILNTLVLAALIDSRLPQAPWPFEQEFAHFYKQAWPGQKNFTLPPLIAAANRLGIPWRRDFPTGRGLLLGHGRKTQRCRLAYSSRTSYVAATLANDKHASARLLRAMGLPAPENRLARSEADALAAAAALGYPVVLKPNDLGQGKGVEIGLKDAAAVRAAFKRTSRYSRTSLVERFITGEDHRILVIGGKVIAVARRRPARVVGDGTSTVNQLVAKARKQPERAMGFQRYTVALTIDDKARAVLQEQNLTPDSVPAKGQLCLLRRNANVSEGGTAEDVTAITHPDNLAMAVRATRAVGLDVAGIDFLTTAIDRSWREVGGAICEINDNPHFGLHEMGGPPPADIGEAFLGTLFPGSAPARIPIVAIVEPTGAAIGRQVKQLLQGAGLRAALATEAEIFMGEPHVRKPSAAEGLDCLLWDPEADAAVFSLSLTHIADHGLPFDRCDVALAPFGTEDLAPEMGAALRLLQSNARNCITLGIGDEGQAAAVVLRSLGLERRPPVAGVSDLQPVASLASDPAE